MVTATVMNVEPDHTLCVSVNVSVDVSQGQQTSAVRFIFQLASRTSLASDAFQSFHAIVSRGSWRVSTSVGEPHGTAERRYRIGINEVWTVNHEQNKTNDPKTRFQPMLL